MAQGACWLYPFRPWCLNGKPLSASLLLSASTVSKLLLSFLAWNNYSKKIYTASFKESKAALHKNIEGLSESVTACYRRCATRIQWRCRRPVQTYCSFSRTLIQDVGRHQCCSPGNRNSHRCQSKEQTAFLSNDWNHNQEKRSRIITNVAKRHDEPTHCDPAFWTATNCLWMRCQKEEAAQAKRLRPYRCWDCIKGTESTPLCPNVEDSTSSVEDKDGNLKPQLKETTAENLHVLQLVMNAAIFPENFKDSCAIKMKFSCHPHPQLRIQQARSRKCDGVRPSYMEEKNENTSAHLCLGAVWHMEVHL